MANFVLQYVKVFATLFPGFQNSFWISLYKSFGAYFTCWQWQEANTVVFCYMFSYQSEASLDALTS